MKLPRITIPAVLVLAIALSVLGDGCSQGEPEVDKSAEYTPESLAQELAFRFSGLSPESKKLNSQTAPPIEVRQERRRPRAQREVQQEKSERPVGQGTLRASDR